MLAGALLAIVEATDPARKESWRKRGQAFFQRRPRGAADGTPGDGAITAPNDSGTASA